MYLISAKGYVNARVHFLRVQKAGEIWGMTKGVGRGMGVKNISDLVLKEIYGICEIKNLKKEQIEEYRITEKKFIKSLVI